MGLIESEQELSERDRRFGNRRVFDADGLRKVVEQAGFTIESAGGLLLKPFTHALMERLAGELGDDLISGLSVLGRELPELAGEIHVLARAR
jgi:hypothetical protein